MTRPPLRELTDALVDAFVVLSPAEQQLAAAAYRLLLAGQPVNVADVAGAAGWPAGRVEAWLDGSPGVYLDGAGRLVGFWGLAVEPVSAHRVELAGAVVWAWCALDPLFIAPAVGVELIVTSVCPVTGAPVHLRVTPSGVRDASPAGIVVSMLAPERVFDADVRASFCHFVHYLGSPAAGDAWTAGRPETFALPLTDASTAARDLAARVFPTVLGGLNGSDA